MGKMRTAIEILILSAVVFGGTKTECSAVNVGSRYNLEQARGLAPEVKAYINGSKMNDRVLVEGKVTGNDFNGGVVLRQNNIKKFSASGESIHYVVLFDNSASVDEAQFGQAKRELLKMRQSLKKNDRFDLYTVGSDNSRGEKKRVVSAVGKKNLSEDKKKIGKITRNKSQTVLYRSLTQILRSVDNSRQRTVILLITDGEDDSQGKNNRTYEVNPEVKKSKVPIFGLLLKNVSRHPDREKMANTRKSILNEQICRGYYEECTSPASVSKGFKNIGGIIENTYVVSLREENNSNRTTVNASLFLTCNGEEVSLRSGAFSYSDVGEKDNTAPTLTHIKKTGSRSISFQLRDDKCSKICGADDRGNYTVRSEDKKVWKIAKVTRKNTADDTYEIVFEEELYSGKYTIECTDITDDSQEKNPLTKKASFSFDGLNKTTESIKIAVKSYWWIALVVIVIAIGGTIIFIVKRKPGKIVEIDAESLNKADSRLVRLTITDRAGTVRDVEWNVEGSIFVGRSNICNIYFDDDRLSRQHFAIEVTKMACYIEDLETTNGTFVNGVKISGKRMLLDGDVITAGREKIEFYMIDSGGDK